jgi:hypothetical protein
VGDIRRSAWEDTRMKLYEVTVMYRDADYGGSAEREVWEIRALSEEEARRIATSKGGQVLSVTDTLFRSAC